MSASYTLEGNVGYLRGYPRSYNMAGVRATCACIVGIEVTRVDSTHLQVDFDAPVLVLPTLQWIGAYKVAPVEPNAADLPELLVLYAALGTVTPGDDYDSVERIILTTSEQGPTDYNVTIFGLEAVNA